MKLTNHNELKRLAREINDGEAGIEAIRDQVLPPLQQAAAEMRLQGQRLCKAKALVPHGDWEDWLAANCPLIHKRTANRYMDLASRGNGTALADSPLTIIKQLYEKTEDSAGQGEAESRRWTPPIEALSRWSKVESIFARCPLETWPAEQRDSLKERLDPIFRQLYPEKF